MGEKDLPLFNWAMEQNLGEIVRFHNLVVGDLDRHSDELAQDPIAASAVQNYMTYLATNTFLMIYSHCEEYLYLVHKGKAKEVQRGRGFSIMRYEPILAELGVPTDHPSWRFMLDATVVRHCLLHANGRLAFMRSPSRADVEAVVTQYPSELKVRHDRLWVEDAFAARFVDEIRNLRAAVDQAKGRGEKSS